jgi:hypothetical protein
MTKQFGQRIENRHDLDKNGITMYEQTNMQIYATNQLEQL